MSWIRTAVNRAVEAGARNNLTRTVRDYAGYASAEGAKVIHERFGPGNLKSFKHLVKQLSEVSVLCRGVERVQLLRRWLVALKEVERLSNASQGKSGKHLEGLRTSDESNGSPRKPTVVYYVDSDKDGVQLTFRDAFLQSQALEGITLSMILEAPNDEEISLVLEIYGLSLIGGKEVHNAVISSLQDLSKAFSGYEVEVLLKREELLQYAQGAIAGLKINSDIERIDAEACRLKVELDKIKESPSSSSEGCEKSPENTSSGTVEALEKAIAQIGLCSKFEALLLRKKSLSNGDSPGLHAEKLDKLKVLSESLANSTSKAEKRMLDHRSQKEEALYFRMSKANEVIQLEKDLEVEIGELQKQRNEIEAKLKKVNNSLAAAHVRLHNVREERENFDEASNEILAHLKTKEDELLRSISSYRSEGSAVDAWINFLEDTWNLKTSFADQREKQIDGELQRYGDYFVNLVISLLSIYKEKLGPSVACTRKIVESLRSCQRSELLPAMDETSTATKRRKDLEEEYLDVEAKLVTTLSVVDTMKKQFYIQNEGIFRKDDQKVKELFEALEKISNEFESIERPKLEIETLTTKSERQSNNGGLKSSSLPSKHDNKTQEDKRDEGSSERVNAPGIEAQLAAKQPEPVMVGRHDSAEEIGEWEFDALEEDLKNSS